ncbi:MAG TPA: cytochrome c, partial [Steroidobacteraceae bacterium]|nr:cytochrome c [Steroidobacteraceae bacterium]
LMNWLAIGLVTIAGLLSVAYSVVFLRSESMLKRTYPVPTVAALALPTDATSIAEGERLAVVHGCTGCHGRQLQGGVMFDDPKIAHIVAPNLTQSVRNYTDAEFIVAIRHGLRPDGHTMIVMPSEGFLLLTDEDLGRIIAFVRNLPVTPGPTGSTSIGPIGRVGLVTGLYKTTAQHMLDAVAPPEATNEEANFGRYLARTTCVQCHAADLRGDSLPEGVAPDLRVVATYSPETFATLMRTGIAIGDRKLGMMTNWAVAHLSHLTDAEIAALYSYLHELPEAAAH